MDTDHLLKFTKTMYLWEQENYIPNHDSGQKDAFGRWGQAFLKQVAKDCEMKVNSYTVRYNKAGPACTGDLTLHHTNVYISFNGDLICRWILYRSCKGQKDYTGGMNQQAYWRDMQTEEGYNTFIERIKNVIHQEQSRA